MAQIPHPDFRCYYVWLPVLTNDTGAAAARTSAPLKRPRATHYWDADLRLARHLGATLGIGRATPTNGQPTNGIAWDAYLLYNRDATAIEHPSLWMHQLGIDVAPTLDVPVLRENVRTLLEN